MFYCDPCATDKKWPRKALPDSRGTCEVCGKTADCYDIPSSQLPKPPNPMAEGFWKRLGTQRRNALLKDQAWRAEHGKPIVEPWDQSVKELLRIPGIGPGALREIAEAVEKSCV